MPSAHSSIRTCPTYQAKTTLQDGRPLSGTLQELHRLLLLDLQVAKLQTATVRRRQKQPFSQKLNVIFDDYRRAHLWHGYHAPPQLSYVIVPKSHYKMVEIEHSRRFPTAETTTAELTQMVQAS